MRIHFERTTNLAVVRAILIRPEVWRHVTDDASPPAEDYQPNEDDRIWYVLAYEERHDGAEQIRQLLGVFMFLPQNAICFEIHVAMLPFAWGRRARAAGEQIWAWMWAQSPARRIVASAPATNRLVIRYAERSGMQRFGVNERSFLRAGTLIDQVLLGISAPF